MVVTDPVGIDSQNAFDDDGGTHNQGLSRIRKRLTSLICRFLRESAGK
jgi:hypothetical protein